MSLFGSSRIFLSRNGFFAASAAIVVLQLTNTQSFSQDIETVKGIRVVHNNQPLLPDDFKTEIEFVRKIGGKGTKFNDSALSYPFDVGTDLKGNVYIVDAGNDRVVKLDPSGKYVFSFGEKGTGPGQFSSPVSIDIDKNGNIYIGDRDNIRVQAFSSTGGFEREFDSGAGVDFLRVLNSGRIVMGNGVDFSYFGETDRQKRNRLVRIFDPSGNIKERFGEPLVYEARSTVIADRSFRLAVDDNDFIYLAYAHRNLIEKYDAKGKVLMRIDRTLKYPETRISLEEGIENLGSERPNYISAEIDVDDTGRIWVMTYSRQKNDRDIVTESTVSDLFDLEIYDDEGILTGRILLDTYYDRFRIFGDRLFFIDTLKSMYINEYRIIN